MCWQWATPAVATSGATSSPEPPGAYKNSKTQGLIKRPPVAATWQGLAAMGHPDQAPCHVMRLQHTARPPLYSVEMGIDAPPPQPVDMSMIRR